MKKVQFKCKVLGPDGGDTMTTRFVPDITAVEMAKNNMCVILDTEKGPGYTLDPAGIDIESNKARAEYAENIEKNHKPINAKVSKKAAKADVAETPAPDAGKSDSGESTEGDNGGDATQVTAGDIDAMDRTALEALADKMSVKTTKRMKDDTVRDKLKDAIGE